MTLFVPAALLGWAAGAAANWAADVLPARYAGKGPGAAYGVGSYLTLGLWPRGADKVGPGRRAVLLQAAMVAVFVAAAWQLEGRWPALVAAWCYSAYLMTVLVIDVEHRLVLNTMLIPAALAALALSWLPGMPGPANAMLGGAAGFAAFLLLALVQRGALGAGDVKLAGVIGLMVGLPQVFTALVIGTVLGGVAALALLVTRRATRKSYMAYAPYLAVGALVVLLRG